MEKKPTLPYTCHRGQVGIKEFLVIIPRACGHKHGVFQMGFPVKGELACGVMGPQLKESFRLPRGLPSPW